MKMAVKVALHSGCGFVCLWLLNLVAPFTGILFPINAVTVLIAGIFGLPGIGTWSPYPLIVFTLLGMTLIVIAIVPAFRESLEKKFFL